MHPKSKQRFAPCAALVLAGCASASPSSRESIGTASVAITNAPADGTCVQITVAGYRTVTQSVDLMPGASTVLALDGLPLGTDTFTANAFGTACAMVNPMSVPNWVSVPVTQTVAVSPPASVALVMERNGNASVSVDFPNEPDGSTGTPPACMPPQAFCAGVCVDTSSDSANCGRCGHDCQGGACNGACEPVTLASGQSAVYLAVDSANVYWSDFSVGAVMKLPVGGGTPVTLAGGLTNPTKLASDGTYVYWLGNANAAVAGSVFKVPVGGGAVTTVSAGTVTYSSPIALNATGVYWFDGQSLETTSRGGGPTTTLVISVGQLHDIAANATNVFWLANPNSGGASGSVMSVPVGGGMPTTLAAGEPSPQAIAVDNQNVYWVNMGVTGMDGTVMKEPLGGGTATALASGQCSASAIAADGTNVYWLTGCTNPGGTVMSVPRDGGTPVVLATGTPIGLAVDATSVYWVDTSGRIQKVAKP